MTCSNTATFRKVQHVYQKQKTCLASSLLIFAHASLNTVRTESVVPVKDVISHRRLLDDLD